MKLLIQELLQQGQSPEEICERHGLRHTRQNGKILFNYDQLSVRDSDPVSQQCRGVILRDQTWEVVAVPMFRFFNYGQSDLTPDLDWSTAVFEEKYDGTLIIAYYDAHQETWCCATRNCPEANLPLDSFDGLTFTSLFNDTLKSMGLAENLNQLMPEQYRNYTFCFELCSAFNQIVCFYPKPFVRLLAVRNNQTLEEEVANKFATNLQIPITKTYAFSSVSQMLEVVNTYNPKDQEGLVVKDSKFNRIKIKNPSYVALNRAKDSLANSHRACVELILLGKEDDVLGFMPEIIQERIHDLKRKIGSLFQRTRYDFQELNTIENTKEFALAAQTKVWPGALFALRNKKVSSLEEMGKTDLGYTKTHLNQLLKLCQTVE